jgi:hypothetical protein
MFYPVDQDRIEGQVIKYRNADKYLQGHAKNGKAKKGFEQAQIKNREVK